MWNYHGEEGKMKKLNGAQIMWECIVKEGVKQIFGYPGGQNLPIYHHMTEYPIYHVLPRHEQGAAHMADGYARASGKVGVALATSGPGATNLVTGIANAMLDSSPVVFFTGQVGTHLIGYDAFQEVDVVGMTMPITKHNYLVTDVRDLTRTIREAFYIAKTGRPGPVLIDMPRDVQVATMDWEYDESPIVLPGFKVDPPLKSKDLEQAIEMINKAKKPVILAGHGVLLSGAMWEVMEFAEKTRTPIAQTLLGIGSVPASHPLNMGMMGMHGESWVNEAIQEADLLLAFGMRFDDRVTGNLKSYAQNAKKIHFEIDPSEVNKNVKVDLALLGDLGESLRQVIPHVEPRDHNDWNEHISDMRMESNTRDIQNWKTKKLHAAHVISDLSKLANPNSIVVTDVGQNQMWAAQYFNREKPYSFITSGGLGTMGFGLPAAIGVKFARPDAEVWCIAGDGGFQMTQAELQTLKQEGLKVNIVILNNGYLGMVRQWQELFFTRNYSGTPMTSPDFVKIAEAHGHTGIRVTKRSEVEGAVRKAQETEGTVVIEFRVEEEDLVYPMVPAGAGLNEMIRRPEQVAE
jgi:acetolactate synthase I/II/III large subunit